jgi:Lipopolysaccharide-assembly
MPAFKPACPVLLAALALTSCGYHVVGHTNILPKTIKIIAVPEFGNGTPQYRLPVLLTADVTRELISRTKYTVVADQSIADATLVGAITNYSNYPIIFDPISGRATSVQIIVQLQLTLTDRHSGKVLFSRTGYEFRERYEVALDPQQYFDESGTAMQRLSKDVARSVVSAILENF